MNNELKLNSTVSKVTLLNNGFKYARSNTYSLTKYLYKDSIYARIMVDLDAKSVDWEVTDKFNGDLYAPFYNEANGENNIVAIEVINKFDSLIKGLQKKHILKGKTDEKQNCKI